jgi:hypothetical protein
MLTFNQTYRSILLELSTGKNVVDRFIQHFFYGYEDANDYEQKKDAAIYFIDAFKPLMQQGKTKFRDIFQYEDEAELMQDINDATETASKKELRKANKTGARLVFSNEFVDVRRITTFEAAAAYGKGTTWCVSSTDVKPGYDKPAGLMWFDHYTKDGNLYYIMCKPGAEKLDIPLRTLFNKPRKMQLHDKFAVVMKSYGIEVWFTNNDNMDARSFMQMIDAMNIPMSVFKRFAM